MIESLEQRILLSGATFGTAHSLALANNAYSRGIAAADLNKDGYIDLITADEVSCAVSVMMGKGDGTFQDKVSYSVGLGPWSLTVGDLNNDGWSDLATGNYMGNTVSVLLNNKDGTFAAKADYGVGDFPQTVTLGDFNQDSVSDLVVANYTDKTVSVLLGKGDGTFHDKADYSTGSFPYSVAVGDFNHDGVSDLVTSNYLSNTVSVLLGQSTTVGGISNGDGAFGANTDYSTGAGTGPWVATVGDFNNDGWSDLATANVGNKTVSILLNKRDGTFQDKVIYAAGYTPMGITVADFNRDGQSDLAVANADGESLGILLGNADGTFQARTSYTVGNPYSIVAGDFNGDGWSDLASASYQGFKVDVLLNTTTVVSALPATEVGPAFPVSWTGANNDRGSTLATYDIYVRDDGGAWTLWLDNTTATTASYDGSWGHHYDFYSEATDNARNEPRVFTTQAQTEILTPISSTVDARHPYKFTDDSGDTVTIKLSGLGSAQVLRGGADLEPRDAQSLVLSGTDAKSSLTVTVTGAKSSPKTTTIDSIDLGAGQLKTLCAPAIDITGAGITGSAGSYITSITVRDLSNGADITLPGVVAKASTKLTARQAGAGTILNFGMPLSSATFIDFGGDSIQALSLGTLNVKGIKNAIAGDFAGDLQTNSLKAASVAGSIGNGTWTVAEPVSSIKAASLLSSWHGQFAGRIGTLTLTGDMAGQLQALQIGALTIKGNMNQAKVTLGSAALEGSEVLKTLTVGKAMTGSTIQSIGGLGAISSATMAGNVIYAGGDDSTFPSGVSGSRDVIRGIKVTGTKGSVSAAFSNTKIAAKTVTSLSVVYPDTVVASKVVTSYLGTFSVKELVGGKSVTTTVKPKNAPAAIPDISGVEVELV